MRLIRCWGILIAYALLVSCAPPQPSLTGHDKGEGAGEVPRYEHDLGIVLSHGQTIEHEFRLRNPTARPARILRAQASMPCCSEIVSIPDSIPAHGEARLSVCFKPGYKTGRRLLGFHIRTDRPDMPVLVCALRVELVGEVLVATIDGQGLSRLMGESGRQILRIITHRYRDQGRGAPETVDPGGTAGARFLGEARERTLENEVIETVRDLIVDIPPRARVGLQTEVLTFGWPDGRRWEHPLHWTVTPHLSAVPEALIVRAGDDPRKSVMIHSRTSPFRVIGIQGADLDLKSGSPEPRLDQPAMSHVLRLTFDHDRSSASGPFDVTIRTDHPEQPEVVISILMARSERGGVR